MVQWHHGAFLFGQASQKRKVQASQWYNCTIVPAFSGGHDEDKIRRVTRHPPYAIEHVFPTPTNQAMMRPKTREVALLRNSVLNSHYQQRRRIFLQRRRIISEVNIPRRNMFVVELKNRRWKFEPTTSEDGNGNSW